MVLSDGICTLLAIDLNWALHCTKMLLLVESENHLLWPSLTFCMADAPFGALSEQGGKQSSSNVDVGYRQRALSRPPRPMKTPVGRAEELQHSVQTPIHHTQQNCLPSFNVHLSFSHVTHNGSEQPLRDRGSEKPLQLT